MNTKDKPEQLEPIEDPKPPKRQYKKKVLEPIIVPPLEEEIQEIVEKQEDIQIVENENIENENISEEQIPEILEDQSTNNDISECPYCQSALGHIGEFQTYFRCGICHIVWRRK